MNCTTPNSNPEVPCALKSLVHDDVGREILGSLTSHGCERTFLDWVQINYSTPTMIEEDELKTCPMTWCRKTFDTCDSMICHVFECPRLPNAWYWCPYHRRPERFLDCNKGCEVTPKPTKDQAAMFFSEFFRQEEAGPEESVPLDAYQSQGFKQELGTGVNHDRSELLAPNPPSLKRTHNAMMGEWVDERSSYPSRRSRIAEVYGSGGLHELYAPPTETSISLSVRRQAVLELNDSLSAPSNDGGILASNTPDSSTDPDGQVRRDQHGMSRQQMSQAISPAISASAADVLSTPIADLSSLPSNMLSPVSSIAKYVYPPSTIISPATMTRDHSVPETVNHHEEVAGSFFNLTQSPFDSMEQVPKQINSALSALGPYDPILGLDSSITATSAREPQQAKDSILQHSFNPFHHRYQFEEVNGPTISFHANVWTTHVSNSEGSNDKNTFDRSSVSKAPRLTMQSTQTDVDISRPEKPLSLPVESTSTVSPQIARMESLTPPDPTRRAATFHGSCFSRPLVCRASTLSGLADQELNTSNDVAQETDLDSSLEAPSSASSRFQLTNGKSRSIESAVKADIMDFVFGKSEKATVQAHDQNEKAYEMERSDTRQSLSRPNIQLGSPHDNVIAATDPMLNPPSQQSYLPDGHQQSAAQYHNCDFPLTQALHTISRPHCFDCNSLLVRSSAPEHVQVAELQVLVEIVNTEWKKRIKLVPDLWQRCSTLLAPGLFERALQAFRDFINGTFAYVFEDVFAIVQLAFAAAFLQHWLHAFFPWKDFCLDALQWERAISSDAEKVLFLNVMNPLPYSDIHDSFGSITLQNRPSLPDEGLLSDVLRGTEVYKVLIGLLDDFEMANISKKIHRFPKNESTFRSKSQRQEIKQLTQVVTQPLLQRRGLEGLRQILIDTERYVKQGVLQNTREVEVALKSSGRWSSESREISERFCDSVTFQCDEAMLSPSCRNDHHVYDLERMLSISKDMNRSQSTELAIKQRPHANALGVMHGEQPVLESPISMSSTSNGFYTPNSSPNTLISSISTNSSHTLDFGSQNTSPNILSQDSIDPTSPDSSPSTTSIPFCRACCKEFKGSPQDAASNYRRHLRESPRHNKHHGLKCPRPDCSAKPPMRSDNLKGHLRNFHRLSSKETQSIIDSCRLLARRRSNDTDISP